MALQKKAVVIDFSNCFASLDTLIGKYPVGCGNSFYKMIDSTYVLVINYHGEQPYDSCQKIVIDTAHKDCSAELFVYKEKDASMLRYCNDYGDHHVPLRLLTNGIGNFFIKFCKPAEYKGTALPNATIFVDQLIFQDSVSGHAIKIEKQLYWNTVQWGPAG